MKKNIFTLMALMAALCACNKEQMTEPEVTTPDVSSQEELVFTATMEGADTKVTLDGMTPSWQVNDEISINGFQYFAKAAGASTTFTAQTTEIRPTFVSGSPVTNTSQGITPDKLVDQSGTSTKWCDHVVTGGIHIIVSTGSAYKLQSIKLWNGGDTGSHPGRRWKDVKVYGASSADGLWDSDALLASFTSLNLEANNGGFAGELPVGSTKKYKYYKIEVLSTMGESLQQMSDMQFVVDSPSLTAPYNAYFPASLYNEGQALLPANITETWVEGKFSMPMYAKSNTTDLNFKNLCGVLKITVKSSIISAVKSIRVSSANRAISGRFNVNDDNAAVLVDPATVGNTVTVTYTNAVATTPKGAVFFVAIPAQSYRELKIELSSDGQVFSESKTTKSGTDITVARNNIYPLTFEKNVVGENCYIVNKLGVPYSFPSKKGQSLDYITGGKSIKVLWESFGTSTTPNTGDVVSSVSYEDGWITVKGNKNGNAVVALFDGENGTGAILWSWHIWVCKDYDPNYNRDDYHIYKNNAGIVMDRNLGAISDQKGNVGALGLFYQWGRKDPFLGSSSNSSAVLAMSTGSWETPISSHQTGLKEESIEYSIRHPMQFINNSINNQDWYYAGDKVYSTDNTRWTTSDKKKGIYDPCPAGWRVPDGGSNGLWCRALGVSEKFNEGPWNNSQKGMDFGKANGKATSMQLSSQDDEIWYPAAGGRNYQDGSLSLRLGDNYWGSCWTTTPSGYYANYLYFYSYNNGVDPTLSTTRASGKNVRCVRE